MSISRRTLAKRILLAAFIVAVSAEAVPRLLGLTDFPIYRSDPELGYIPIPNQAGRFLNTRGWTFNDYSMATDVPWKRTLGCNVLLIGNSIVQGGGPLDQKDRLGTILQERVGPQYRVWPIAVGGWSNVNETAYLEHFGDVVQASDFFIWEYMAGGLSELSHARSEFLTPTSQPWLASFYVTRRYLLPLFFDFGESELPPTGDAKPENLVRFEAMLGKLTAATNGSARGIIFLYPEKDRFALARQGKQWLPERSKIEALAKAQHVLVIDIAQQRSWNESLYRDGAHLTPNGDQVLARILFEGLQSAAFLRARPTVHSAQASFTQIMNSCG